MDPIGIRNKLHQYIDAADEKKVQALYDILEGEIDADYIFTENDIRIFEQRSKNFKNGGSKGYSMEEARNLIFEKMKKSLNQSNMETCTNTLDQEIIRNLPNLNSQQKKVVWNIIKCFLELNRKKVRKKTHSPMQKIR